LQNNGFTTICDSTNGAIDLYDLAKDNLMDYIEKVAQRQRLKKNGLDDVIGYCHEKDKTDLIPIFKNNGVPVINKLE